MINSISRIGFNLNSDYTRNSIPVEIVKDKIKITSTPASIIKKVDSYLKFLEIVKSENDEVIRICGVSTKQEFIIEIKPFDSINNLTLKLTILHYYRHIKSRHKFYLLLHENNHMNRSTYLGTTQKILIDFNCGHNPYLLTPSAYSHTPHCTYCSGAKVVKGVTDIATTHPASIIFFKNKSDTEKYSFGSEVKTMFICPDCGTESFREIAGVIRKGLRCKRCYDGISFPQKFINNLLFQLVAIGQLSDFTTEYKPFWRDGKSYDNHFILNGNEYIIENHGLQHYANTSRGRTYIEEKENDIKKLELALSNGISEENYIVIDCRYSNLEYIKKSICTSILSEIFDLINIDWLHCFELSLKNLVKTVCEMWNEGKYTTTDIQKKLKLGKTTIRSYLKQGEKLGWCLYDAEIERLKCQKLAKKARCIPIICLNNRDPFNSIREASKKYNISEVSIAQCCNGKSTFAGTDSITGEKLVWVKQEKYNLMSDSDIRECLDSVYTHYKDKKHPNSKRVVLLDATSLSKLDEFPSSKSASIFYNINFKLISDCCRGKRKLCGISSSKIKLLSIFYIDWEEIKHLNYSLDEIHTWKANKYSKKIKVV